MNAKHPRPCECGCGEPIAQKQRGGTPKRFSSDMCQRRATEAAAAEAEAQRLYYNQQKRESEASRRDYVRRRERKRRHQRIEIPRQKQAHPTESV